jgi:hypothetical protein
MRQFVVSLIMVVAVSSWSFGLAAAEPANPPTAFNACVGNSSTTANIVFQPIDPDKLRSDQARQDDGQPGRADSVNQIPQCVGSGLDRGITK